MMLFSLNANASTSMLARMCSNWLKFRFHCKNGSTFSFYFNPRESPFLSNANFVILPHQGHIKSVLVCGTLFEKKGLLRTCKVLATQTIFVYNRGTSCHYISAGMGTFQVKNRQFFYNLHLTLSARGGGQNGQKFSGKLVTFVTIAIEILPLSRSF